MQLTKFDDAGAFVIRDLDDSPCDGPVRLSAKVTQANAKLYARVGTYRHALLGERRGGGAAGIKAEKAERAAALDGFVEQVGRLVDEGSFLPDPAAGVDATDLAPLRDRDPRNPLLWSDVDGVAFADVAAARSAAACAEAHLGGLDDRRVAIQWSRGSGPLVTELARRGARVVAVSTPVGTAVRDLGFAAGEILAEAAAHGDELVTHLGDVAPEEQWAVFGVEADVFVPLPTLRSVSDRSATMLRTGAILPSGEQPVAPKALAELRRRGIVALPDTVALAGPAIVGRVDGPDAEAALAEVDRRVADIMAAAAHEDGPLLGSFELAEEFLRTWRDELPFGRPLP